MGHNVITLVEGNELNTYGKELVLAFNEFFASTIENLGKSSNFLSNLNLNNIDGILVQFEIHLSTIAIKQKFLVTD